MKILYCPKVFDSAQQKEFTMWFHQAEIHGLRVLYFPKVYKPIDQAKIEGDYLASNKGDPDFAEKSGYFNKLIAAYAWVGHGQKIQFELCALGLGHKWLHISIW